mmetsp:Transcript_4815/g.16860  ORF Transcript_4815/g.16860 Transcript_4815/m.16860 type:complete len:227 (-) Transcript_4815:2273-2953(-)
MDVALAREVDPRPDVPLWGLDVFRELRGKPVRAPAPTLFFLRPVRVLLPLPLLLLKELLDLQLGLLPHGGEVSAQLLKELGADPRPDVQAFLLSYAVLVRDNDLCHALGEPVDLLKEIQTPLVGLHLAVDHVVLARVIDVRDLADVVPPPLAEAQVVGPPALIIQGVLALALLVLGVPREVEGLGQQVAELPHASVDVLQDLNGVLRNHHIRGVVDVHNNLLPPHG